MVLLFCLNTFYARHIPPFTPSDCTFPPNTAGNVKIGGLDGSQQASARDQQHFCIPPMDRQCIYIENFLIPKLNHLVSLMVPPTNSWIPLAYSLNSFQESSFSKSDKKILCWEIPPTTFAMSSSLAQIHNKRALQLNLRYRCMPILRKSYLLVCNYPYPATVESKCSEESPTKIQVNLFSSHTFVLEKRHAPKHVPIRILKKNCKQIRISRLEQSSTPL